MLPFADVSPSPCAYTQTDFQAKPFVILWPPDCPPELAVMLHAATTAEKLAKATKLQAAAMKLQVSAQVSEVTGIMRKSPELVPSSCSTPGSSTLALPSLQLTSWMVMPSTPGRQQLPAPPRPWM